MIDNTRMQQTLLELLAIPSPSGFTDEIVHYVGQRLGELDIPFDLTRRGTIRARLAGRDRGPARAIVNHVDTIGAMVRFIRDDGRLRVWPIGFWSSRFAEGARATLFSERGAFRATLLPMVDWGVSRDRGVEAVPIDWEHIELRLDAPVFSAADVRALGIDVGDYIALDSNPEVLANGYIVGRAIDNKGGAAAVLEALRHLTESGQRPARDTYVLFTITETVGSGTGAAILPEVSELVTVDFASVPAQQKSPFKRVTIAAGDAAGPYDYHLTEHLQSLARLQQIPHQRSVLEAFHSDAASALAAGHDVRTAVLAYAGDASHSIERTHIDGLHNMARLLVAYVCSEPAFQRDTPLTSVDDFPRQLSSERLPPAPQAVPSVGDLFRANRGEQDGHGEPGDREEP
jgi:peptidase M42 family hydrolase